MKPEDQLADIEMTTRLRNCLVSAGNRTVGDVLKLHWLEVFRILHLGRKSQHELLELLRANGYELKGHAHALAFERELNLKAARESWRRNRRSK